MKRPLYCDISRLGVGTAVGLGVGAAVVVIGVTVGSRGLSFRQLLGSGICRYVRLSGVTISVSWLLGPQ